MYENTIKIKRSYLEGHIRCPPSKSYTHRAIAISSLSQGSSKIINPLFSRDTLATINGCKKLGASIIEERINDFNKISEERHPRRVLMVDGKERLETPDDVINAENSGTTIRILASMSSLVTDGYTILTGDESLRRRPMKPLISALNQLGVNTFSSNSKDTPPLIIKGGGIKGGNAILDGSISSQFVSSLLISCIYSSNEVSLKISGKQVSRPYIESTIATMNHFGVHIDSNVSEYYIPQAHYTPTEFTIPGDFSTAALLIAAGILSSKESILVSGLNFGLPQGDIKIIDIVREMGAEIKVDKINGTMRIFRSHQLKGIDCNLVDSPDLLPVVSILSLICKSPVTIYGISHARFKETDRVHNIANELQKLGVNITEKHDSLKIVAPSTLKNAMLNAYGDHRLFMAFTIVSLLTNNSMVTGVDSVDVSFPDFIPKMKSLGSDIDFST